MKIKYDKKNWICFGVCVAITIIGIVLDQLTKSLFERLFQQGKLPITVIDNVVIFTYALNDGAAWGSLSGSSVLFFTLTIVALPVFVWIFVARIKRGWCGSLGFACVISGTIGNAIDRAFLGDGFFNGKVRDFIATQFLGKLDFICNIADIFLTIGVVILILGMIVFDDDAIFSKRSADKGGTTDHE